jgi:hypothetical protein
MTSRFDVAAWRAPESPGSLLPGSVNLLMAVDVNGHIDAPSWGQRFRHHGGLDVFCQLWSLARNWPTTSRMRLSGHGMQRKEIRMPPTVCAGTGADLTTAMIRTRRRADPNHIR